jgi:hypothetical protein
MDENPWLHGVMRPGGVPEHSGYKTGRVSKAKLQRYKSQGYTEIALRDQPTATRYSRIAVMNIDDLLRGDRSLSVRWVNG